MARRPAILRDASRPFREHWRASQGSLRRSPNGKNTRDSSQRRGQPNSFRLGIGELMHLAGGKNESPIRLESIVFSSTTISPFPART